MRFDRLLRSAAFYTHLVCIGAVASGVAVYMLGLMVLAQWLSLRWFAVATALLLAGVRLLIWCEHRADKLGGDA